MQAGVEESGSRVVNMAISSVILQGDCCDILPTLDAGSVQCCITSPPYWGLRDYGTAQWEGGDEGCDHKHDTQHQKQGATSQRHGRSNVDEQRNENHRNTCPKCGARRIDSQLGLEATPDEYVARMVAVFREVRRVLRDDGTLWLNLGDSYTSGGRSSYDKAPRRRPDDEERHPLAGQSRAQVPDGLKPKDLCGIPWRVAFALQADGWYLRSDIIWAKPNPMPESCTDRPTKAHEYLFLLTKRPRYFYDADAVRETSDEPERAGKLEIIIHHRKPIKRFSTSDENTTMRQDVVRSVMRTTTRNRRSVWTVPTQPYREAHFATFPEKLIEPCILAGCPEGGTVLDPFAGSGTTGVVAQQFDRAFVGVELSLEYCRLAEGRIAKSMRPATARSGGGKPAPLFSTGVPTGAAE